MIRSVSLLAFASLLLVAGQLSAECGCAGAPCEQTTLQSAPARDDVPSFGASLAPVAVPQHSQGMELDFNSGAIDSGFELIAFLFVGLFFLPLAIGMKRLIAHQDRLITLQLYAPVAVPAEPLPAVQSDRDVRPVRIPQPMSALAIDPAR